jgi:hypothetical protein
VASTDADPDPGPPTVSGESTAVGDDPTAGPGTAAVIGDVATTSVITTTPRLLASIIGAAGVGVSSRSGAWL